MKRKYKSTKRGRNKSRSRKYKSYKQTSNKSKYVLYLIIIVLIIGCFYKMAPECITFQITLSQEQEDRIRQVVKEEIENYNKTQEQTKMVEEVKETKKEEKKEEVTTTSRGSSTIRSTTQSTTKLTGYRITSYYPGDNCASTAKTGSGKSTKDFKTMKIGNKSVYTYNGKIVVATATKELLNTGYSVRGAQNKQDKHYFKYYDTLTLTIDGKQYEAIVLDSCGAAMWQGYYRVDIFVPSSSDVIDRSNVTINI